jgi:hypothetical protein
MKDYYCEVCNEELDANEAYLGKTQMLCSKCLEKETGIKKIKIEKPYNSKVPAFNLLANAFDLLLDAEKLEELLKNLTQDELDFLYQHPLLEEYDLLP